MNSTVVWFDLETVGTEPHHPNIQLAAVAMRDGAEVGAFEAKIAFDRDKCDAEALRINHFAETADQWAEASPEATVLRDFARFLARHSDTTMVSPRTGNSYSVALLGGHNVTTFDIPRLRAAYDRAGIRYWPGCWWYPLDTYGRALWHFNERGLALPKNFQLQTLAAHFKIPAQGAAHEALADVRLCARLAPLLGVAPMVDHGDGRAVKDPNRFATVVARREHLGIGDEFWSDGQWHVVVGLGDPDGPDAVIADVLIDDAGGTNGEECGYDDECYLTRKCAALGLVP